MRHLVLIDGHSLAYRMYFALERTRMQTAKHFPTWAIYGFFKALFDLLKLETLDGIAVAFDMGKVTFRTEMYEQYKAHRKSMPDELSEQMGKIREGIELLGIPIFQVPNYEADDLIGTIARQAAAKGIEVSILTGDQDAFQIIDNEALISILVPAQQGGLTRYDRQKVFDKWGVYPEQVTDFKGLKGDTSDNIPGVPGIGDKTAAKLLAQYGTLENLLEHVDEVAGNKVRESLITYREQALLSKDLATIRYDAPVSFSDEACHLRIPDIDDFLKFLVEMEFRSFINNSQSLLQPFIRHLPEAEREALKETGGKSTAKSAASTARSAKPETEPAATQLALLEPDTDDASLDFPFQLGLAASASAPYLVPFQIVTEAAELARFLEKVRETKVLVLDIETSGLDCMTCELAGIALSWSPALRADTAPTVNPLQLSDYPSTVSVLTWDESIAATSDAETLYIPIQHPGDTSLLPQETVLAMLQPLLTDPAIIKVGHNLKFERNVFKTAGVVFDGLLFDTMVTSYVQDSNRRHGLKSLAYEVLGHTMQEITDLIGKGKKQIPFTQVPLEEAAPYAACDAAVTLELASHFVKTLSPELRGLLYEVELPLVPVLAEMEYAGVSLDVAYLKHLSQDLEGRLKIVEAEIYDLAEVTFNLNSPKQVGEVLFEKLKLPARGLTPTKSSYTTNAKVIESLAEDYPIAQKILDYRQLFKLKSTYVDALPLLTHTIDGRLHTSFNQTITGTGRLSSSEPNLQNIPIRSDVGRQIRQAFVPQSKTDWLILSADYSQIELRLLAHFSEDPMLIEAFRSGEDIHKATAALVFDVPLEEVTKQMRYQAKAVNFGIIYGQTAFGLSNALGIPPKEAGEFIQKYFERYPKVKSYIEASKTEIRRTGVVKTLCGRVRDMSEGLKSPIKSTREFTERAAFNLPLQGSAADLMKVAMIRLQRGIARQKLQSKLILQVHDEVVLEVYQPELEQVRELVHQAMCLEQPLLVPLEIDISEGPSWMEVA